MSAIAAQMKHTVFFEKGRATSCSINALSVRRTAPKGAQTFEATLVLPKTYTMREENSILRVVNADGSLKFGQCSIARTWNYNSHLAVDIFGFVVPPHMELPLVRWTNDDLVFWNVDETVRW